MNERTVLDQRVTTLDGLIDAGGLLGPAGANLGAQLRSSWEAERRLLRRILAETAGNDVRATLELWQARTTAFLARAEEPNPGWLDRDGNRWDAEQVLGLLADTLERLDAWLAADEPLDDDED
jgi:hypothetical protein